MQRGVELGEGGGRGGGATVGVALPACLPPLRARLSLPHVSPQRSSPLCLCNGPPLSVALLVRSLEAVGLSAAGSALV